MLRQFIWVVLSTGDMSGQSLCGDQGTVADMIATSQDINYCLNTLYARQTIKIHFWFSSFLLDIKLNELIMMAIDTEMDDSDRLVSSLVMVTDRGRVDTDNLLAKEVKERTEPKKKPQAYNIYKYQILS